MEQNTETKPKAIRLNVSLDDLLHKDLRTLSVRTGEPLTKLVPRLLRAAVKAELAKIATQ